MSKKPAKAITPAPAAPAEERSIHDLVMEIKSGTVNPKVLAAADRQACVSYLSAEGASVAEIAQVLKHSDRTIARDRKAIQEAAAIQHDPKLAGVFAGYLISQAELSIDRIRRVTRDRETPPADKIDGEWRCYDISDRFIQRLQSLGYLPNAVHKVQAELTHHDGDLASFDTMEQEVSRMEEGARESGKEIPTEIIALRADIARARLAARVEAVSAAIVPENTHGL